MKNNILFFCLICLLGVSCKKEAGSNNGQPDDYFPLSTSSNWVYLYENSTPNDSFKVTVGNEEIINGKTYKEVLHQQPGGFTNELYYRKSGSEYFVNITDSDAELPFLKTDVPVNTTWNFEFNFIIDVNNTPATLKYEYTLEEKLSTFAIEGISFNDVLKVSCKISSSTNGSPFTIVGEEHKYYANHIGLIREVYTQDPNTPQQTTEVYNIIRHRVF